MSSDHTTHPTGVLGWFSNPLVGLIGSLASVIGVALAFFFYYSGERKRDLVFYVHPVKTTVVKSGQSSALRILHNDHEITSDVTAVQFAIWNHGNESIRPDNILREITVSTRPLVPILEAKILKFGRTVSSVSLDNSRAEQGILLFSWKILEHNDGAIIQLIHAGPADTGLIIDGVIEGQSAITTVVPGLSVASPSTESSPPGLIAFFLATMSLFSLALLPARFVLGKMMESMTPRFLGTGRIPASTFIKAEAIILFVGAAGGAIYFFVLWLTSPSPPFSF